jgi:apolipoprotein N-acyltransferase
MEGQLMKIKQPVRPKQHTPQPQPEPPAAYQPPGTGLPWPHLLPAVATGFLLWLSYFPVAWGWLGWVALVPLLCLVRSGASGRRIFFCAWAAGLTFFVPALQWLRVAYVWMYGAWAALAIYVSLYVPVGILLLRRLERSTRWPLVITLPLVWTALELLRSHLISGFPWYFLGHTQHDVLPLIQVSDLAGAYALTALVAAGNAVVFELLYRWRRFRVWFGLPAEVPPASVRQLLLAPAAVLLLVGAYLGYGFWRINEAEFAPGPRVALIQGNVKQQLRDDARHEGDEESKHLVVKSFSDLCEQAARQRPRPDLIVWPETSFNDDWPDLAPDFLRNCPRDPLNKKALAAWLAKLRRAQARVRGVGKKYGTNLLLGLESYVFFLGEKRPRKYNSALLVGRDGKAVGRYDKIHRVPFGEFVPFRHELPWMNVFNAYGTDFSVDPGEGCVRLPLGKYHFGVLICYEDTDPELARQYVAPGGAEPPADFLVNISNDGWFDGTSEHDEHLAICRFRAVESRRPVVRAVNMGISAVIDGNGRVLRPEMAATRDDIPLWEVKDACTGPGLPVTEWHRYKKVQGVLTATVPLDTRASLYARWGDWLPWTCWLGIAVGLFWPLLRRRPAMVPA